MTPDSRPLRFRHLGIWMVAFTTVFAAPAFAQEGESDPNPDPESPLEESHDPFGFGVKKLAYSVGLKVVEIFDDNILLSPDDEESDRITAFLLKARLRYGDEGGDVAASYRGRERVFDRHDEFDGMEHLFEATGRLRLKPFRLEAGVDARDLKEPFDELQVTLRLDSRFDREFAKVIADFNRFDVELEVARARFTLDDPILDRGDYRRLEGGLLGAAEVWAEASVFVEARIHETEYDEPDFGDLSLLRVAAGVRGALSAKTRGEIRVGFARADLDAGTIFPGDEFTGLVAVAAVTWEPTPKQEIRAEVRREPIESVLTGLAIVDGARLTCIVRPSERWRIQGMVSWERERESDGSNNRRGLQARGGVQWSFGERVYADAGALYRAARSGEDALEYENLRFSIGVGVTW